VLSVKNHIQKISDVKKIPYGIVLNTFIGLAAAVYSHNRIKFQLEKNEQPRIANAYCLNFAPSGFGKNRIFDLVKNSFFAKCFDKIEKDYQDQYDNRWSELNSKAEKMFTKQKRDGTSFIDYKARDSFLDKNEPRMITPILSDITVEGLQADRWEVSQSTQGSILFKNTEFLEYLLAKDKEKSLTLGYIADIYDGDDTAKSVKSHNQSKKFSKQIPHNMLCYASINVMHKDSSFEILIQALSKAAARRSFLFFDANLKESVMTFDERHKMLQESDNEKLDFNNVFFDAFNKTFNKKNHVYKLNRKSKAYEDYLRSWTANETEAFNTRDNDVLKTELIGRHWKTLKLATILQAIYDPENEFICEMAMSEAIEFSEYFGQCFGKFLMNKPKLDFEKMFDYFEERIGKPITTMELRKTNFFNANYFKKYFDEFKSFADEYAQSKGLIFEELKLSKNGRAYVLKTLEQELKGE